MAKISGLFYFIVSSILSVLFRLYFDHGMPLAFCIIMFISAYVYLLIVLLLVSFHSVYVVVSFFTLLYVLPIHFYCCFVWVILPPLPIACIRIFVFFVMISVWISVHLPSFSSYVLFCFGIFMISLNCYPFIAWNFFVYYPL